MAARKGKKSAGANTAAASAPKEDLSWRARDDLHTLSRAQEIQRDKKRMSMAQAEARKQMESLYKVVGGDKAERRKRLEDVDL